ncbi:hypothetical protein N7499_010613 [Penicillium canescens]|uniref:Uncharacterized protein n=1 Tax=Penicillium canescens TaxID=5083 RepID=A0AAD6IIL2_PENCN|nr:uncharacterized protein N7446_005881 [Penicillium canescens]KAJ5990087.1 hypothetical protein N7522_010294 [Penicillium canescens]KAJ6051250.1 hypothetical protein N7460_001784 [Penicillium canescens]KAJ6061761.1 hypothetical protein N7446_005881 [Penicillium canescens]KAJ6065010.1 hypothetical protein N7444_000663 [Penicillium canescens]KAJ6068726.1 hypothetical protein N7499_010613 [Penicillium canescens]
MTPIINNLPSDNLPADVDYPVQADPIKTAADPIAGYQFGRYQIMGADRQMWIEDPKTPMCPVERSLLDITAMITEFTRGQPIWYIEYDRIWDPPFRILVDLERMDLPTTGHYHQFTICKESTNKVRRPVPNHHDLFTGPGVLVVALMYRADGPMWSDIAIAQYKTRFPIDTLQHIYIDNCTNTETEPLVTMLMGGSQDAWYGITPQQSKTQVPTVFEYGTPSYQALLGSATGKAVAALILGAFPRGTWRIAKIACWYYWGINMRFDIEPVPQPSLYTES